MTALAAIIALSSTSLLAQAAEPAASDAAPVVVAPPAPAPTAESATPAATSMAPVVHQPDAQASPSPITRAAPARAAPRVATRATPVRAPRAAPAPTPAAPAPAPVAAVPAPAATTPAPTTAAPSSTNVPASSSAWDQPGVVNPAPAQPAESQSSNNGLIEVVAIAAGILILGFLAFLFTRRRRRDDEVVYEESVYDEAMIAPAPAAPPEFAPAFFTGTPESDGLPPDRPLEDLPADFDRFGPHVQAAYRGPTPDNPSLSLKTRLKRARFFDERDRKAGVQPASSNASVEAMINHARTAREAHHDETPAFWPHDDRREDVVQN